MLIEKPVHLLFDEETTKDRKVIKENGSTDFYFDKEQFHVTHKDNFEYINADEFNTIKLTSMDVLLKLAEKERVRQIREGEKKGTIKQF